MLTAALFIIAKMGMQSKVIDRGTDKQNIVYTHNGIVFSLKKEQNFDICCNMDDPWGHYAKKNKWNRPEKDKYFMTPFIRGT